MKYDDLLNEPVPQTEPLDERQVKNNASGFVYGIDKYKRLERFLILGSDSPTYYQSAKALTRENAKCVQECLDADCVSPRVAPCRTLQTILVISLSGRAPKNDPAIFALALASVHPDEIIRTEALGMLSKVCRTSTHLFSFVKAAKSLGKGFGRAMKRAVANWYTSKTVEQVAYQAIKYRQREGYTHKRLLDMSHAPSKGDPARNNLYLWMKGKEANLSDDETCKLPGLVLDHMIAMQPETSQPERVRLVKEGGLPWEALPTECNADPKIWEAMLPKMGLTALIRNLGNMTRVGTISPLSDAEALVVKRLADLSDLKLSRIHPFHILQAMAVYSSGHGFKGSGTWTPSRPVLDGLDKAFYETFANVTPANKRFLIALDVSGSMTSPFGGSVLSCRDATAALALVTMATEPQTHVVGFTSPRGNFWDNKTEITPLAISPRQRLTDAIKVVSNLSFGSTDCALPMLYALENNLKIDTFLVLTDNETYAGALHPMAALKKYRAATGINSKLIVCGMTSTGFSIADPQDEGCLDVVGFDSNVPALISDFSR